MKIQVKYAINEIVLSGAYNRCQPPLVFSGKETNQLLSLKYRTRGIFHNKLFHELVASCTHLFCKYLC